MSEPTRSAKDEALIRKLKDWAFRVTLRRLEGGDTKLLAKLEARAKKSGAA